MHKVAYGFIFGQLSLLFNVQDWPTVGGTVGQFGQKVEIAHLYISLQLVIINWPALGHIALYDYIHRLNFDGNMDATYDIFVI